MQKVAGHHGKQCILRKARTEELRQVKTFRAGLTEKTVLSS